MFDTDKLKKSVITASLAGAVIISPSLNDSALADNLEFIRTLKIGLQGDDVKILQDTLKQLGYFKGNTTRFFGENTKKAVKAFQKDNNINNDGVFNKETFDKLNSIITNEIASNNKAQEIINQNKLNDNEILKIGMHGKDVNKLQEDLKTLGYFKGNTTEYFGNVTKNALIEFQKNNNVKADGVFDKNTKNLLINSINNKKDTHKNKTTSTSYNRLLRLGMSGNDVNKLQNDLKKLGYFTGSTTEYFGAKTKTSLMNFQKDSKLSQDGILGKNTLSKLEASLKSGNTSIKPEKPIDKEEEIIKNNYDRLLRIGMSGNDVNKLQNDLKKLGYFTGNTTNYFGNTTKNALMSFQKDNKLSSDGILGKNTLSKLEASLKSGNTSIKPEKPIDKEEEIIKNNYDRLLRVGMSGNDVNKLQNDLKKLGYFTGNTTNYFGNVTKNSLILFQRQNGLSQDGILGINTVKKLEFCLKNNIKITDTNVNDKNDDNIELNNDVNTGSIISTAKTLIGVPYVWGGNSKYGFDCSGFTQYVYAQAGVKIPRNSGAQASSGNKVSRANLKPGDLIIFSNTYRPGPSHTGIYLGNSNFIHASSGGKRVMISSLNNTYYNSKFSYGRRLFK